MATYLLLRNNKESGPLSLDELIKIGLKPYDLVWVNGKSAAWRYPSEIKELIPYAPIVEEQPYDRFYQKSSEHNQEIPEDQPSANKTIDPPSPTNDLAIPVPTNPAYQETPVNLQPFHKEDRPAQTNKNIFVSFPERKPEIKPKTPAHYEKTNAEYSSAQRHNIQPSPINAIPDYKHSSLNRNEPIELEEKYSQPLDEIKEMYVQTLNQRKKRNARKQAFLNGLKIAAAVLIILTVGMLIGMYFNKDTETTELVSEPIKNETNTPGLGSTSFVSNSNTEDVPAGNSDINTENKDKNYQVSTNEKLNVIPVATNKNQFEQNNKPVSYAGTVTDSQTNERKRVIRENDDVAVSKKIETPIKKSSIENIWKDVTIKANDFQTGPFGGIKDLTITLANNSSYSLDKVEIEVKYIGLEKQVVKTQKMVFNDVLPGGQVYADVPRTSRGIDVDVTIKKINVKDFSFASSEK